MEPVTITIQLDIDKHLVAYRGYDRDGEPIAEPQTIEEVILDLAAMQVANRIDKESSKDLATRVRSIRDEEIRARVTPEIEAALTTPFRRTNSYGEPSGAETTLRDEIVRVATDYLSKPSDSYHRDRGTVVQAFVAAEVKKAVDKELKGALDEAKAAVREAVTGQAAALITQTITNLAGVRTP